MRTILNSVTESRIASGTGANQGIMELLHRQKPTSTLIAITRYGESRLGEARPKMILKEIRRMWIKQPKWRIQQHMRTITSHYACSMLHQKPKVILRIQSSSVQNMLGSMTG